MWPKVSVSLIKKHFFLLYRQVRAFERHIPLICYCMTFPRPLAVCFIFNQRVLLRLNVAMLTNINSNVALKRLPKLMLNDADQIFLEMGYIYV